LKFSSYKSYVCSTLLQELFKSFNESILAQITKDIQF